MYNKSNIFVFWASEWVNGIPISSKRTISTGRKKASESLRQSICLKEVIVVKMDANIVHMDLIKKQKMMISKTLKSVLLVTLFGLTFTACQEDTFEDDTSDVRDRFVGTWTVSETESNQTRNFDVTISKSDFNSSRINIFNFYKLGQQDSVIASVSTVSSNTITIPNQVIQNTYGFSGSGVLQDDNTIEFSYTVDDGNGDVNVTAVFSR